MRCRLRGAAGTSSKGVVDSIEQKWSDRYERMGIFYTLYTSTALSSHCVKQAYASAMI